MPRTPLFRLLRRAYAASRQAHALDTSAWDLWEEGRARAMTRRDFMARSSVLAGAGLAGACARPAPPPAVAPSRGGADAPVAVFGAGIAGLTAAWRLAQAGIDVRVYEAQNRIGGRMLSLRDRFPDGQVVELGGELIDTPHATIRALVAELDIPLDDLAETEASIATETYYFGGAVRGDREVLEAFGPLAARISRDLAALGDSPSITYRTPSGAHALDRTSIAEYLERDSLAPWFRDLIDVAYTTEYGLEIGDQSALNLLLWISPSTDDFAIFGDSDERHHVRGGNDRIPRALAERLGARVQLNTVLEAVGRRADGALVCSVRDGARTRDVFASRVLLTLPFTMLRQVRLDVPLSAAKRLAIDAMGYGTNAKLMIGFLGRPWRTTHRTNGSTMSDLPYQTTWETSRLQAGAAGVLTNFTGGRQGLAVGAGTPDDQARLVVESLERVYPGLGPSRGGAPAVRFHWPTNAWVRGSYAAFRPGQWTSINGAAGEAEGPVFFAGEHCSLEAQGFMEGGCETGTAAAAAILASLGRPATATAAPRGAPRASIHAHA